VSRRELRLGRNDAQLLLPFEDILAERVPALIETALVSGSAGVVPS
jgi:hypothetical protein